MGGGDPATLAFYQAQAPRYTLSFGQAPSRHLDPFLDRLEPGVRVLELGCGAGATGRGSSNAASIWTRPTGFPQWCERRTNASTSARG